MADFKKVKHKLKTLFAKNVHSAHHNITTLAMTSSMDHVLPLNPEQIDVLTGTISIFTITVHLVPEK